MCDYDDCCGTCEPCRINGWTSAEPVLVLRDTRGWVAEGEGVA